MPELKLVLETVFVLAGGLVAVLSATRFALEGRRFDLFICCGFFVTTISWLAFSIVPSITQAPSERAELWAGVVGPMIGWSLIAVAPFVRGRVTHRRFALGNSLVACAVALIMVWSITRSFGFARSRASTRRSRARCPRR